MKKILTIALCLAVVVIGLAATNRFDNVRVTGKFIGNGSAITDIYPDSASINVRAGKCVSGSGLLVNQFAGEYYGHIYMEPSTNGDLVVWSNSVTLSAGTYEFGRLFGTYINRGIAEFSIDGAVISTNDMYTTNTLWNVVATNLVSFASDGKHTVSMKCIGKNASSSGWYLPVQTFWFIKQ